MLELVGKVKALIAVHDLSLQVITSECRSLRVDIFFLRKILDRGSYF